MKNGSTNRRSRSRNNNRGKGGNGRATVYDSNGPDVRIRGTAHQISEKYEALAKDARSAGDTVMAESYLQHAEHYQRIIVAMNQQQAERQANYENNKAQNAKRNNQQADGNKKPATNDDLSLPSSILGDGVKVRSESVRALEDA